MNWSQLTPKEKTVLIASISFLTYLLLKEVDIWAVLHPEYYRQYKQNLNFLKWAKLRVDQGDIILISNKLPPMWAIFPIIEKVYVWKCKHKEGYYCYLITRRKVSNGELDFEMYEGGWDLADKYFRDYIYHEVVIKGKHFFTIRSEEYYNYLVPKVEIINIAKELNEPEILKYL